MSETPKKSNLKEFFMNSNQRSHAEDDKLPSTKKQRHLGPGQSLGNNPSQGEGLSILTDFEKKMSTKACYTTKEVERKFKLTMR